MDSPIDVPGVRILGSLIEKESTTPDNYPLTLNALTAACNQMSNRDPVLELDEATVSSSLAGLARRNLVGEAKRGDSRVKRFRHLMADTLRLHQPEIAVMCVLMLRGPQTAGELRTRTARLYDFPELARVELALQSLMSLTQPLVVQLPRRPGQKEVRYAHLLSGEPQLHENESAAGASPARETRVDALEREVASLRSELAELRTQFAEFRREISDSKPRRS
jgi:uncharacterized protein